jgi:hypothetical protein
VKGFIKRYILHVEWHPGYRPHISIRKMPRPGQRVVDGGVSGVLESCSNCSGDGMLLRPDAFPQGVKLLAKPMDDSQESHGS